MISTFGKYFLNGIKSSHFSKTLYYSTEVFAKQKNTPRLVKEKAEWPQLSSSQIPRQNQDYQEQNIQNIDNIKTLRPLLQ